MKKAFVVIFILPLLFSFRKNPLPGFQAVKLFGVTLDIPVSWKMYQYSDGWIFTRNNDTLHFMKNDPDPVLLPLQMYMMNCPGTADTECLQENERYQRYNDSIERAHPEMSSYVKITFYSDDHKWACNGYLPSGNTRAPASLSFYDLHRFNIHCWMRSSPMNVGEAAEIRDILRSMR